MKFKKHISIFLAILFLSSNIGLAFNVHYCDDVIASISLKTSIEKNNSCSSCCVNEKSDSNCCTDKELKVDKKTDNVIVKPISFQFDNLLISSQNYQTVLFDIPSTIISISTKYYCEANAPPFYKLYNQYIFYDKF